MSGEDLIKRAALRASEATANNSLCLMEVFLQAKEAKDDKLESYKTKLEGKRLGENDPFYTLSLGGC